jgi:Domain of unknown function (DU1801)
MQRSSTSPDEHIASLSDEVRGDIATLDARISEVMAGEDRVLWEGKFWGGSDQRIIGYGEYTYKGRSGRKGSWFVVGLAAQKNYITVFVNAVEDGAYLTEQYADRLGKAKIGRSSISFKRLDAIDLDVLIELVGSARRAVGVASA